MIKSLLLVSLVILCSCSKTHELKKRNGIHFFENVESKIDYLNHVEWKVGKKKNKTVSRGIRLRVTVPIIDDNAKRILRRKPKVDSWIFRYSKSNRGKSKALGHVYYHFDNISANSKSFSVNIYYHASVVSDKFRAFKCPAFGHRKYLPDVDVDDRTGAKAENIFIRTMGRIKAKVLKLGFKPHIFSIGREMIGDYTVDFALYDSKTKKRHSIWSKVQGQVQISQERKVSLPSCAGIKEENGPGRRSNRTYNIQNMQINR